MYAACRSHQRGLFIMKESKFAVRASMRTLLNVVRNARKYCVKVVSPAAVRFTIVIVSRARTAARRLQVKRSNKKTADDIALLATRICMRNGARLVMIILWTESFTPLIMITGIKIAFDVYNVMKYLYSSHSRKKTEKLNLCVKAAYKYVFCDWPQADILKIDGER